MKRHPGKDLKRCVLLVIWLANLGPKKSTSSYSEQVLPTNSCSRATRLYTRVVLIDFDQAEDRSVKHIMERTG
jgi:hypothetical protein